MLQVSKLKSHAMSVPLLHSQLHTQLSQWIHPQDKRHLLGFSENVAAMGAIQKCLLEPMALLSKPSRLPSSQPYGTLELLCE